jgi:hypothetical protein
MLFLIYIDKAVPRSHQHVCVLVSEDDSCLSTRARTIKYEAFKKIPVCGCYATLLKSSKLNGYRQD